MDQVAALHWIQENIAEFGGQPNNVTIIGHGYGAACAHLLMISPMAKGLFINYNFRCHLLINLYSI
jgi:neuroligin